MLQCLIVDLYFNMFGNKNFNVEKVISEFMIESKDSKNDLKSLFHKALIAVAVIGSLNK